MLKNKITYKPARTLQRKAVDAAERIGKRFGAFVQRTAKQSIRRGGQPSAPGQPPKSRSGALKNFIRWAYDPAARSVVIGPEILPGRTDAPEALEKGKRTTRRVFVGSGRDRKRVRKSVNYDARPFMVPALEKRLPDLLKLWQGGIK